LFGEELKGLNMEWSLFTLLCNWLGGPKWYNFEPDIEGIIRYL